MNNAKILGNDAASEIITTIFLNGEGFHSGAQVAKVMFASNVNAQWKEAVLNFALGLASELVHAGTQTGLTNDNLLDALKRVGRE